MRKGWWVAGCLLLSGLSACVLPEDDDGGGFGFGTFRFTRGFTFIRDRNVYLVDDADLTQIVALTTEGDARHPSISPNGRQVVFAHLSGFNAELQVVPTTGDGVPSTVLAATPTASQFRFPVFSPDSKRIAFVFDRQGFSYLGAVNVDGTGFEELAGSGSEAFGAPSYLPDGTAVIAPVGISSGRFDKIARVSTTGAQVQYLRTSLGGAETIENRLVVSPSGTRAAFDGRTEEGSRIFVLALNGTGTAGTPQPLTDHPSEQGVSDTFPSWYSESELVLGSDSGGNDNVYRVSATPPSSGGNALTLVLPGALEPFYGPN